MVSRFHTLDSLIGAVAWLIFPSSRLENQTSTPENEILAQRQRELDDSTVKISWFFPYVFLRLQLK